MLCVWRTAGTRNSMPEQPRSSVPHTNTFSLETLSSLKPTLGESQAPIRLPRAQSAYLNLWLSACCCATSARHAESPEPRQRRLIAGLLFPRSPSLSLLSLHSRRALPEAQDKHAAHWRWTLAPSSARELVQTDIYVKMQRGSPTSAIT